MKITAVPAIKYTIFMDDNKESKSDQQVFEEKVKYAPSGPYTVWEGDKIPGDPVSRVVRMYYTIEDSDQHYIDLFV